MTLVDGLNNRFDDRTLHLIAVGAVLSALLLWAFSHLAGMRESVPMMLFNLVYFSVAFTIFLSARAAAVYEPFESNPK